MLIERWRQHANTIRLHSALGYRPCMANNPDGNKLGAGSVRRGRRLISFARVDIADRKFPVNFHRDQYTLITRPLKSVETNKSIAQTVSR